MRLVSFLILTFLAVGCAPLKGAPQVEQSMQEKYAHLAEVENTTPPPVVFFIDEKDHLAAIEESPIGNLPVFIVNGGPQSLENILVLVQENLSRLPETPLFVGKEIEDISVGVMDFRDVPLHKFLRYLQTRYNVSVRYQPERGLVEIAKHEYRKIILPPILNSPSGQVGGEDVSVEANPDNLRPVIEGMAQAMGIEILTFSETTGTLAYRGRPYEINEFSRAIEQEVVERLKFVTIHIMVLEMGVNNGFQREIGVKYQPTSMGFLGDSIFGTFKIALPSLNPLISAGTELANAPDGATNVPTMASQGMSNAIVNAKENKFSLLLNLLEQWGETEIVTAPAVMTTNGVPVGFRVTEDAGYWLPGDLTTETVTNNGETDTLFKEGRPEWIEDEVGIKLVIRPKIIRDSLSKENLVELDISLDTSEIIGEETTSWQRDAEMEPVVLKKPLKSNKVLSSRAVLHADEMLLLAKIDRKENTKTKTGIPGMLGQGGLLGSLLNGEGESVKETKTYILINVVLPKERPAEVPRA